MQVGKIEYAPDYGRNNIIAGVKRSAKGWGLDIANTDAERIADHFLWEMTQVANDNNHSPLMIGLTGKRNVGKSTVARLLEEEFGFASVHAFSAGKDAAVEWFRAIGCPKPVAMVYGDLKDKPSPYLPGNVAPRHFLEKFGHFMGAQMGVDWTLALEINRVRRESPRAPIVVESLVYEAPWFKRQGGIVLRLVRPDHDGPAGVESDAVQASIDADHTIEARSVDELEAKASELVRGLMVEKAA